jgi:hypothetical protein
MGTADHGTTDHETTGRSETLKSRKTEVGGQRSEIEGENGWEKTEMLKSQEQNQESNHG